MSCVGGTINVFAEPDGSEARDPSEAHRQLQRSLGLHRGEGAGGGPATSIASSSTSNSSGAKRRRGGAGLHLLLFERVAFERFFIA